MKASFYFSHIFLCQPRSREALGKVVVGGRAVRIARFKGGRCLWSECRYGSFYQKKKKIWMIPPRLARYGLFFIHFFPGR